MYAQRFVPGLHSVALSFLGGAFGLWLASAVLGAVTGSWIGILAAAGILTATGFVVDFGLRVSARQQDVLWTVASLLWFIIGVPVAAYLAPGYSLRGLGTNAMVIFIVTASEVVVGRASPWRTRWRRGSS